MKKTSSRVLSYVITAPIVVFLFSSFVLPASAEPLEEGSWAKISVDLADRSVGPMFHGASAAHYGLAESNVPDINTLLPIKASHMSEKPPNGLQHPGGDVLRVAPYFFKSGGNYVIVCMHDYYERWYYPSRTVEQFIEEAVIHITNDVLAFKEAWSAENPGQNVHEKVIYMPFNEPESDPMFPSINSTSSIGIASRARFNSDWLAITNKVKEIDPDAIFVGPNLINYKSLIINSFIPFCIKNDCVPEYVSWHDLSSKAFGNTVANYNTYRTAELGFAALYAEKYPDRENPFPLKVDINEYASQAEIAVGGSLVQYLTRYDECKIFGALPFWSTPNSLGSLLAAQNEPNGGWWAYKWYADTEGDMVKVSVIKKLDDRDTYGPGLYGFSTIDDNKKQVNIVFGGTTGESRIVFNNVTGNENSPDFFEGADKVHATVWYAGYTGLTGFCIEPTQIINADFDIIDGSFTLPVETGYCAAYYAVITEAVNSDSNTTWFQRYEAEDAQLTNVSTINVYPRTTSGTNGNSSASNGRMVSEITASGSIVNFTNVTVPVDGNYRLDIVEGSGSTASLPIQTGVGTSSQRQNSEFYIKIDGEPSFKAVLRADYSLLQLGMVTQYIDLTAGTHSIKISKYNQDTGEIGQGQANLDCIELTYNGEVEAPPSYRVQAEFAEYDYTKGLKRESSIPGFEGAGYVTGFGASDANTRFVMSVMEDGMYNVTLRLATESAGILSIDYDRKNIFDLPLISTGKEWVDFTIRMFLRTGINLIDVKSTAAMRLDYIDATYINKDTIFSIEAEDCVVVGTPAEGDPPMIRDDVFAKYASGGKYVNGITSYDGEERYLEITEIDVPEDGTYKLVIYNACGQSSGTHSYNNKTVDRYAQISVNGAEPETHHFKNTISWQQFASQTFDVELKKGMNTIKFSNDNSYNYGSSPYGGNNAAGTAGFTYITIVPNNYTPAFDKFEIYQLPVVYNYSKVLLPLKTDGSSRFKLGSTIPVKFQLMDVEGNYATYAAAKIYVAKIVGRMVGTEVKGVSTSASAEGNLFGYNYKDNHYIFNLNTKPLSKGTYQIRIDLGDGSTNTVIVTLE